MRNFFCAQSNISVWISTLAIACSLFAQAVYSHKMDENLRIATGPTFPPPVDENLRIATGPTFPPPVDENLRIATGPTFPPPVDENLRIAASV